MTNIQHEQLFQELDNEVAATCSGGTIFLYQHDGFNQAPKDKGGRVLKFEQGSDNLGNWNFNDQTSSIKITGNVSWVLYSHSYNRGTPITLAPGLYNRAQLQAKGLGNDSLSSLHNAKLRPSDVLV